MATRRIQNQVLLALLIVAVGAILLLDTTGAYDVGPLWTWFPTLFILVGVWALVQTRFRSVWGPVAVIVVAGAVQLANLGYLSWSEVAAWWPVLIIGVGLGILWGVFRGPASLDEADDSVDLLAVFGGNDRHLTSQRFRGGAATAMFGAVRMDLLDAHVETTPAEVNVNAMFGGVELHVPEDWRVVLNVFPFFGGARDERVRKPAVAGGDRPDLVVHGFTAFGGITVKS